MKIHNYLVSKNYLNFNVFWLFYQNCVIFYQNYVTLVKIVPSASKFYQIWRKMFITLCKHYRLRGYNSHVQAPRTAGNVVIAMLLALP